jgi:deoxyribodipyrimidine photo-lyase
MNERYIVLNDDPVIDGDCVIYVMSRDQRVQDNHALIRAQEISIENSKPLIVVFNFLAKSGYRAREHFEFMVDGLKEVEKELRDLGIGFLLTFEKDGLDLHKALAGLNPSAIVFDFSPLNGPRILKEEFSSNANYRVEVVDSHNIIPVWAASDKEEFAAYTFRNKVHKYLEAWLSEPNKIKKHPIELKNKLISDWKKAEEIITQINPNGTKIEFVAGENAAHSKLKEFIKNRLEDYAENRNNPNLDGQSDLSPYLHYGHISSLRVALELTKHHLPLLIKEPKLAKYEGKPTIGNSIDAILEEMIVRKELSDNFCYYNNNYKKLEAAKDWAKKSLSAHMHDSRDYEYTQQELEDYKTHDEAWNAAQAQLRKTGKMHGYMRMYWAKKILEWSPSPELAIKHANYINDHYSIDGGDPNGYVGVLWSIAGLHDRAWFERPVFGKIRYMNYNGLKNKFDVEAYIKKWLK